MTERTTTILGTEYRGRPKVGSLAFQLWKMEQDGQGIHARNILRAKNTINKVYGAPPIDLQNDMTDLPLEGVEITQA